MADQAADRRSSGIGVRVFGMDAAKNPFSRPAQAFPISNTGALLRGLDAVLRVGDIVGVQVGAEKARFRITSIDPAKSADAGQIEVLCVDAGQSIWTRSTALQPSANLQSASSAVKQERRRFERYKCDFGAVVDSEGGKRLWARCSDVSIGGCYLETWSPLPLGANFHLELEGIVITAAVSTCHPNVGMGVRFVEVAAPQHLEALIEKFRHPE
jgi:hypothetical protein